MTFYFKSEGPTIITNQFAFSSSPLGAIKLKPLSLFGGLQAWKMAMLIGHVVF